MWMSKKRLAEIKEAAFMRGVMSSSHEKCWKALSDTKSDIHRLATNLSRIIPPVEQYVTPDGDWDADAIKRDITALDAYVSAERGRVLSTSRSVRLTEGSPYVTVEP